VFYNELNEVYEVIIKMISDISKDNELDNNVETIIRNIKNSKKGDFLLFSEGFLHGFDALSWDYETDINIAINQDSIFIEKIKEQCKEYGVFCGFGYYEKVDEDIYCSYMIVNDKGKIINNYRRISIGWKKYWLTTSEYKEGTELLPFQIQDFKATTIVCGDLWDDNTKKMLIEKIDKEDLDFIIWPNHLDYKEDEWKKEMSNDYAKRTKGVKVPTFLINDISETSPGGAAVFLDGKMLAISKTLKADILIFEIESDN